MQVDYFRDILVPVIGGLGIFMLGLEFMSDGIQNLAVNTMRTLLARIAGTPVKGVLAGTLITGVIQSSTAMTVMVVGLVKFGGPRPAPGHKCHHGRQHRHDARQRFDRAAARASGPAVWRFFRADPCVL
jgi:Na+/Pi-cotransporter